jgi:hypothetical protein
MITPKCPGPAEGAQGVRRLHAGALVLALVVLAAGGAPLAQEARHWSFDDTPAGGLPAYVIAAKTGPGPMPRWEVMVEPTAPSPPHVLAQRSSDRVNARFNLAVMEDTDYQDVDLEVKLAAMTGQLDQGGGLVWRYQDADDYYVARVNPLERNFRVYRVVKGARTQLGSARVAIDRGTWHTMRVVMRGDRIEGYLDGKKHLEARDGTFTHGRIGLWTKADAVTAFDELRASPLR